MKRTVQYMKRDICENNSEQQSESEKTYNKPSRLKIYRENPEPLEKSEDVKNIAKDFPFPAFSKSV